MKTTSSTRWLASLKPLALFLGAILGMSMQAANVNWLGNTDANFNTPANWSAAIAGQTAVFNAPGSSGTTLNNDISGLTLAGITFSASASSSYTINGNAITLGGNITLASGARNQTVNLPMTLSANRTVAVTGNGTNLVIGGIISDGGNGYSFQKGGQNGTLTLSGANTFTGASGWSASGGGTISVSADNNLGLGTTFNHAQNNTLATTASFATSKNIIFSQGAVNQDINVASGTTLTLNGALGSAGTGGGTWRKQGAGTLELAAASTTTAGCTVTAGLLKIVGSGTFNSGSANLAFNSANGDLGGTSQTIGALSFVGSSSTLINGTLNVTSVSGNNGSGNCSVSANLAGSGATLAQINDGKMTLSGANTYTGTTTISAGTLQIGNAGTTGSLSPSSSIVNNAALIFNRTDTLTQGTDFSSDISGTGTLTQAGTGTLILSGANTYSGATTVSAGTLLVNGSISNTVTVNAGTLGGNGTIYGMVTNAAGSSIAAGNNGVGTLTITNNLDLNAANLVGYITNGVSTNKLVVGGNLTPYGTSTISLPNTSLANGVYTLAEVAGTLGGSAANFNVTSPLGKVYTISYDTGGSPKLILLTVVDGSTELTWFGDGAGNAWDTTTANWTNVINGGPLTTFADDVKVNFNSVGAANNTVAIAATVSPGNTVVSAATDYTLTGSGSISGTNSLTKTGAGTLTISTVNDFTGNVALNGGALKVNAAETPGTSGPLGRNNTISFGGGTLQFAAANTADYSSRFSTASGQAYAIDTAGQSVTFAAALTSSSGTLTKTGSGTLTLSGNNTYSGTTTVNGGTLAVSGTLANAAGSINVNGGKLSVSGGLTNGAGSLAAGSLVGSNGVMNILPGAQVATTNFNFGATNSAGGALNMTGGNLIVNATNAAAFRFGTSAGYGSLAMSGGTITAPDFQIGVNTSSIGVTTVSGGSLNTSALFLIGRNSTGVLNVADSGIINDNNTNNNIVLGNAAGARGELNLIGGTIERAGNGVTVAANATASGVVNLNSGTVKSDRFSPGSGTGRLNLNGGTIMVSSNNSAVFNIANFISAAANLSVYVNGAFGSYAGGAVIDTAGYNVTNGASLQSPTGGGVSGITLATQGSGYIGAPYVSIGGDGFGATAVADMEDDGTGNGTLRVAAIRITNPGTDYTFATCALSGGAPTTAATTPGAAHPIAANTSGGLVKLGAGILTMTNVNTYLGNTVVSNGTLRLEATNYTPLITVKSGATLGGNGVLRSVSIEGGGYLAPGASIGTLTVTNLTLAATATTVFEFNGTATRDNLIAIDLTPGGSVVVITNISANPIPRGSYPIINYLGTKTGTFGSVQVQGSPGMTVGLDEVTANQVNLVVSNNLPVAGAATYTQTSGLALKIYLTNLLSHVSDVDSDTPALTSVSTTTNGATLTVGVNFITVPASTVADEFTYVVNDGNGGSATNTVTLNITLATGQNATLTVSGGTATGVFFGVPASQYVVQRSTNLTDWVNISTNTVPGSGVFTNVDNFSDLNPPPYPNSAFYRLQAQ